MKLFRYSGNKTKLIDRYIMPSIPYKRIVEPYFGSGAFSLNNKGPAVGYELNEDLYDLLIWLKEVDRGTLESLQKIVISNRFENGKIDIRTLNLSKGAETYLKINVCSAVVGQLSSWKIYPRHNLPIEETLKAIPRLKEIDIFNMSGEKHLEKDGDLFFIDPPYVNTSANYKTAKKDFTDLYNPQDTKKLISRLSSPIIFTYGTLANEIFPEYDWNLVKEIKVPNIKNGGTVSRFEYVTYLNF